MTDLDRFLVDHDPRRGGLTYRFPNGVEVSVIPDPHRALRWEILDDEDVEVHNGLTTDEAEAKLTEIADLADAEAAR